MKNKLALLFYGAVALTSMLPLALASYLSFPAFNSWKAHCILYATFNVPCSDLFESMEGTIEKFGSSDQDPLQGTYQIQEKSDDDYIWATRTGSTSGYVNDILFKLGASLYT